VDLEQSNAATELREAVASQLGQEVSVTVEWAARAEALVSLSGRLEGLVEVPGGDDAPLSLVVSGQDVMIWPRELEAAAILSRDGSGFALEFESGLRISIDCTA
jgi:hypothetical protein